MRNRVPSFDSRALRPSRLRPESRSEERLGLSDAQLRSSVDSSMRRRFRNRMSRCRAPASSRHRLHMPPALEILSLPPSRVRLHKRPSPTPAATPAPPPPLEPAALQRMKAMSDLLKGARSFTFKSVTDREQPSVNGQMLDFFNVSKIDGPEPPAGPIEPREPRQREPRGDTRARRSGTTRKPVRPSISQYELTFSIRGVSFPAHFLRRDVEGLRRRPSSCA